MLQRIRRCDPLCEIESQAPLHQVDGIVKLRAMVPAVVIEGLDDLMIVIHAVPVFAVHLGPLGLWDVLNQDVRVQGAHKLVQVFEARLLN